MAGYTNAEVFIPNYTVQVKVKPRDVSYQYKSNSSTIVAGDVLCLSAGTEDRVIESNTGTSSLVIGVAGDNTLMNKTTGLPYDYSDAFPANEVIPVILKGEVIVKAGAAGCTAGKDVCITNADGVVVDGNTAERVIGKAQNTAASGSKVRVNLTMV